MNNILLFKHEKFANQVAEALIARERNELVKLHIRLEAEYQDSERARLEGEKR